ncbi:MAG: 50S ribosomal protein L23 [Planctomycetes bacterium]|nr:50S ribosomal protein L23 [Planctomycetota bacterium]
MNDPSETTQTSSPTRSGLALHQVILRPLVTEKGTHAATRHNQYAFEVDGRATKGDIRRAVEDLFHVKVRHIGTQTRRGKARRYRYKMGHTAGWKKAIVTLHDEYRIDFF